MKTMTKKLGAIVLALCLCFSLCCTALAASGSNGSITIDGEAGEYYLVYKIFDLTYADDESSYSYKVVDAWKDFISSNDLFDLDEEGYLDPDSAIFNETDNSATMAKLAQDMLAYAVANNIGFTEGIGAGDDGKAVLTDLDLGWYLVDTTLGTLCMLTTTDPDAEIEEKNDTPEVEKFVDHNRDKEETSENSKTVEYELDIEHITGVSSLILHDHMDMEETVDVTYTFDYANMTVTLIDGETRTPMTVDVDYVLDTEPEDGCDFHVIFTVDDVDYDFSNVSEDGYIEVDIDCTLVAEGASFEDDEIEIPNFAKVTYGFAGTSEWDEADVYEYGFEIFKYTEAEEGVQTALAGATFTLTSDDGTAYFDFSNGVYTFEGWDLTGEAAEGLTTNLVSTDSGNILIEGLGEGTYTITETEAPDGYNKLDYTIVVTITAGTDLSDFTVTYTKADGSIVEAEDDVVPIENNQGTVLPGTGGIGTTIFYIIGGVLVAGAVVVLITRRRMNGSEG